MTVWQYQRLLTRRLLQWSLFSLGMGVVLTRGRSLWRGVGGQFIGWALVNMGIAYFGTRSANQRQKALADPQTSAVVTKEAYNLRLLLWVNTGLDLLYLRGGRWLIKRGNYGTGLGIILQSLFLFLFDLYHAANVPDEGASPDASDL